MAEPAKMLHRAAERLRSSELGDDVSFLLARANALSLAAGHAALEPFGLRVRSYSVLALAAGDAQPSQRELSEFLRLDPSQVVALVDELEELALVTRETDPTDRRAKIVTATSKGIATFRKAQRAVTDAERTLHDGLDPAERDQLIALLRRIAYAD